MSVNQLCFRRCWRNVAFLAASIILILVVISGKACAAGGAGPWREVEDGLLVGEFDFGPKAGADEAKILVLKVDPRKFAFTLMTASEHAGRKGTVKEWCERHQLLGAFNAGMYQEDGLTSVGYMKNFKRINNSRLNRNNAVLAFNPADPSVPEVQIIDRECQDFESLKGKYQTLVQSIRMVSCDQQNVWSQQATGWSTLALGMDKDKQVLIIFCQQQVSVHDFIEILLKLPISLYNAMYLEGGPQASLYLSTPQVTVERHGSWEATSDGHNSIQVSLPIPNVIGIVRKP